jgi:ornithine cyclodeaminase
VGDPVWLSEADVVATVDLPDAIDALEDALRAQAAGGAQTMEKTHVAWEGGHTLHAIGAIDHHADVVATKTWAHTGGGANPIVVMWDARDGQLLAIIEAFALGQLRTGAMTGLATRWLAPASAPRAALIGTGKQAMAQLGAMSAARPRGGAGHSPDPTAAPRLRAAARQAGWPFEVREAASVEEAAREADIVTTATRAREPFLHSAHLRTGTLVNAIGAITPERAEIAPEVVVRCDLVVADSAGTAERLATELSGRSPTPLHEIIAAGTPREPRELTMFKAMGIGLADLAIARVVLERSKADGRGARLAHPQRAQPRLRRTRRD